MDAILRNLPGMEHLIQRSLERSASYGVDPHLDGAPEASRLTRSELTQRIAQQREFFDLAREQMSTLHRLLKGTDFCLALADGEGYVLHVIGDRNMLRHFKKRRCMPGYRWTERDMGTCAIGLALESKTPLFLPGPMMYAAQAQKISNAGAPILAPDTAHVLGVISLSGPSSMMHVHTLGLVDQAASIVTARLRERQSAQDMALRNQYMTALVESDSRGIVTVDKLGRIVHSNRKARALLSLPESCNGLSFEACLGGNIPLQQWLRQSKGFHTRELPGARGATRHFTALNPIRNENGDTVGGLFTITEKKELLRMAVEVTGSRAHFTFDSIIGTSEPLRRALHLARIAAKSSAPVLLSGETGTGKELFAQAIHNAGPRQHGPFVAINCGAIPKELLESELFGHEDGAFTGARRGGRPGKFELADTGTLFLDEIGDMPFDMQVKLLRVLQTGEIQRVGGLRTIPLDLRVISATHADLPQAIAASRFRSDLFYRISTLNIHVPPLRQRMEDIPLLVRHFMDCQKSWLGHELRELDAATLHLLQECPWPGNIRQLESAIARAAHLAEDGVILPEHFSLDGRADGLPALAATGPVRCGRSAHCAQRSSEACSLREMELRTVAETLQRCRGNVRKAAAELGISRPTLYRKLAMLPSEEEK